MRCVLTASAATKLIFILFPKAITNREEVPAPPLVHVPHVRLLASVLCLILVDEVHQEEPVMIGGGMIAEWSKHTTSRQI